ncbi:hypothetical protein PMIN01_06636 [Paraphaeosphaeria minitans]|uniref:Uncharacterized protein n=1 Tax=Paraphaeosphaeria minitans TaxID=565426 RepID=A0A9P6GGG6_9PLEO|nr:hypothetical protein PMIN01_06636 [Paraphaeosphaeria minitans]
MHWAGPATCTQPAPSVCTEASTANRRDRGRFTVFPVRAMEKWRGLASAAMKVVLSTARAEPVRCRCGPQDDPVRSDLVRSCWPLPHRNMAGSLAPLPLVPSSIKRAEAPPLHDQAPWPTRSSLSPVARHRRNLRHAATRLLSRSRPRPSS